MCGLAGAVGIRPDSKTLKDAVNCLNHRGPDSSGTWVEGDVSLVHTRLKIIDLSDAATQPMIDPKTGVTNLF